MQHTEIQSIEESIKEFALHIGFDACGISKAEYISEEEKHFDNWLASGYQAGLGYMERNIEKRLNPQLLHQGTQSIISVILNYFPEKKQESKDNFLISKYAYGIDYHFVLKEKLSKLATFVKEKFPGSNPRAFVDSAPILDRYWAKMAGLGWIGKNSMLINKKKGSFFFIGELLLDIELQANKTISKSYCGTCTLCIDSCPTKAIEKPYIINSNKCISYHTIESKEDIPDEIARKTGNRIFGCDICQDVCPWNRKVNSNRNPEFQIKKEIKQWNQKQWKSMTQEDFSEIFKESPLKRAGFIKIKNNIEKLGSL